MLQHTFKRMSYIGHVVFEHSPWQIAFRFR
ncbi:hypothetical protein C8E01_11162 [Pontibacter virosus]|uniref:Uncharacterized protein n=1 Tax=Pontibacter virosus TaxID=1765052 RepID=A0A2U1ASQ9_9BACT|nr:hypothetical protein C8E01_11162 [Pontibacter virosus]